MDVKGILTASGTPMQLWDCTGKSNQQFKWLSTRQIQVYGSMCLADLGGAGKDGDPVVIQACASATAQQWTATSAGEIKGINSKCVLRTAGLTTNGTRLVLATCNGATSQIWSVGGSSIPTTPPAPPPSSGSSNFHTIAAGVRPRGFGQGTYSLLSPTAGGRAWYVATSGNDANAGTSGAPLRTIGKAAQLAHAGDVVTIANGTYNGSVVVRNSGTTTAPIVFQAAQRGGVVLSDGNASFQPTTFSASSQETGQIYVTLRGLIFRRYASNADGAAAVKAPRGWKIEDCLFDSAGNTAIKIAGSYVTVIKSTVQFTYWDAFSAWKSSGGSSPSDPSYRPLDGIQLVDVIMHDNYTAGVSQVGSSADYVAKFMVTRGTLIDNMESYNNHGSGFWFDTMNSDFTVQNSYFHDNDRRGIFIEANFAPALIQNNVFANNAIDGLNITASQGITVRNNLFAGNPRCIEFTNDPNRPTFPLKNITMTANAFKGWSNFSCLQTLGSPYTTPAQMGMQADNNTYDPSSSTIKYAWWQNTTIAGAASLADLQNKYGWDQHGQKASITWP